MVYHFVYEMKIHLLFHYIEYNENNRDDKFFRNKLLIFHLKLVENIFDTVVLYIVHNIEYNMVLNYVLEFVYQ